MGHRAVFLVGFMASGKSSVGRELARRLGWGFVDLDAHIESQEGRTVPEIFRERGEAGFRAAESAALRHLLESLAENSVVALGGGAFVQENNRELLRQRPTIFLEATAAELWERSLTDGIERPLRVDAEQFAKLNEERLPFYREAAITVVTSGKDPASICAEIERRLQNWGKGAADSGQDFASPLQTGEAQ